MLTSFYEKKRRVGTLQRRRNMLYAEKRAFWTFVHGLDLERSLESIRMMSIDDIGELISDFPMTDADEAKAIAHIVKIAINVDLVLECVHARCLR